MLIQYLRLCILVPKLLMCYLLPRGSTGKGEPLMRKPGVKPILALWSKIFPWQLSLRPIMLTDLVYSTAGSDTS
jgi:hypothetical protein